MKAKWIEDAYKFERVEKRGNDVCKTTRKLQYPLATICLPSNTRSRKPVLNGSNMRHEYVTQRWFLSQSDRECNPLQAAVVIITSKTPFLKLIKATSFSHA